MATLSTYTTLVQNEVDDTSSKVQSIIEQAIKDTYQEVLLWTAKYLIAPTEEDVTATASQRYVVPANTYSHFNSILWKESGGTNFRVLNLMNEDEYYRYYVNADANNPNNYYIKANRVYFDIAPDNAGTVRISGVEVQDELTGATTSVIPDRFARVILLGAIARTKAYERLPESVDYKRMFQDALEDMLTELSNKSRVLKPGIYRR